MANCTRQPGFSLVELVVVVVIIAIIAAIAIPRLSRGSAGASDAAADGDLYLMRNAILRYAAEHGNTFPGPTAERFQSQLTKYTTAAGATQDTRSATYKFGPYLLQIPPCPIGYFPGNSDVLIDSLNSPPKSQFGTAAGWVYNPNTGEIIANAVAVVEGGAEVADLQGMAKVP